MKIVPVLTKTFGLIALVLAGLFYYYLYAPSPPEPPLSGQLLHHTLNIQSLNRDFSWYRPENLADGAPLIFVLHGSTRSGEQVRQSSAYEFDTLADKHGFLVVYPDGYKNHWNDCRGSADYAANTEDIDDIAFFSGMIAFFEQNQNIDRSKVYVTGHSNGGHMAYGLALETPNMITAIAPISASLPIDDNLDCKKSGGAVPVAIFNGTNDPINPYEGGLVSIAGNDSRGAVHSSEDTARYWKELANIKRQPALINHPESDQNLHTSVKEKRWRGEGGIEVRLYTLVGSGHVIPSKTARFPRLLGGDAQDISGPEEIVSFFLQL